MNDQEQIELTLAEFATRHGMEEGLSLDDEGICAIAFGGELETVIESRSGGRLSLSTSLGAPEEEAALEVYRSCLRKHFFWEEISDRVFSINPENGDIILTSLLTVDGLNAETFETALEAQLEEALEWVTVVHGEEPAEEPEDTPPADDSGEHFLKI